MNPAKDDLINSLQRLEAGEQADSLLDTNNDLGRHNLVMRTINEAVSHGKLIGQLDSAFIELDNVINGDEAIQDETCAALLEAAHRLISQAMERLETLSYDLVNREGL